MENKIIFINPRSAGSNRIIDFFNEKNINYMIINNQNSIASLIKKNIRQGHLDYIVCGGDGTINNFIHQYMDIPEELRSKLSVGFFPSGTANDLSNELKISHNIEKAYDQLRKRKLKKIDMVKVNDSYFITGGGFGVSADVVNDVNMLYALIENPLIKSLKKHLYFFSIAKKLLLGFKTIKNPRINGKRVKGRFIGSFIQNQPKTGKEFLISPNSKNDDGFIEMFLVKGSKNIFTNIHLLYIFSMGKQINHKRCIKMKFKRLNLRLKWRTYFMGDGEILDCSKNFDIKVIPKAINVYCSDEKC